ncbi:MAG TPA: hypothetical protein VN380_26855 [Thermoanaerobaculia bacterium]|jgi:hypothetical protein|nr:hypothetical protein [Thermoanaerobaculia bacterium]
MTVEAKHFIEDFSALPDESKREVLAEIIRMSRNLDYPEISEGELLSVADEIFKQYDRREAGE